MARSAVAPAVGYVFDLDETLAPDTTSQYLRLVGVDPAEFWVAVVRRMADGWDQVPSYLYGIVRESWAGARITKEGMRAAGRGLSVFPGVASLFAALRRHAASRALHAEFYLISSGIGTLVRAMPIASEFDGIWTSDYAFADDGRPVFPRRVISFTDKTRPLIEISKGISQELSEAEPTLVNRRTPAGQFRIPFRQMVFSGDGLTDVPCFSIVSRFGGRALAVYDAANSASREAASAFLADGRVHATAARDYSPGGDARRALISLTDEIASEVSGRRAEPG